MSKISESSSSLLDDSKYSISDPLDEVIEPENEQGDHDSGQESPPQPEDNVGPTMGEDEANPTTNDLITFSDALWRVADARIDQEIYLFIQSLPFSDTSSIEVQERGSSVWTKLYGLQTGTYRIGLSRKNTPREIRVRIVSKTGQIAQSRFKAVIATPASPFSFSLFSNEFKAHDLKDQVVQRFGFDETTPIVMSQHDRPIRQQNGLELQVISGLSSVFVRSTMNTKRLTNATQFKNQKAENYILIDPLGAYDSLAPLQAAQLKFFLLTQTGLKEVNIQILGEASTITYPAMSVVGYSGDGTPVAFRFDRLKKVGRHKDGTPFVVGETGVISNSSNPERIEPNKSSGVTVVSKNGARLELVEREGLVANPRQIDKVLSSSSEYKMKGQNPNFSSWDNARLAAANSDNLWLTPGIESVGVQFRSTVTTPVQVRFRKTGTSDFYPALDLTYDQRTIPTDVQHILFGGHRNVIQYLEPNTSYEVQLRQGNLYKKSQLRTLSFLGRTKKASHSSRINGDLVINQGGTIDEPIEYSNFTVRGGIKILASNVVIKNARILGAQKNAIELGAGVSNVKLIGNEIRGWALPKKDAVGFTWASQNDSAVYFANQDVHSILVMGNFIGSPRSPTNSWEEGNEGTDAARRCFATNKSTGCHPWGAAAIGNLFSFLGNNTFIDNSIHPHRLRNLNDAVMGNRNSSFTAGGPGPNSVISYNFFSGYADDAIEAEGPGVNNLISHNFFLAKPVRKGTVTPRMNIGLAEVTWGPILITRNWHRREDLDGFSLGSGARLYKVKESCRDSSQSCFISPLTGRTVQVVHETAQADGAISVGIAAFIDATQRNWVMQNNYYTALGSPPVNNPQQRILVPPLHNLFNNRLSAQLPLITDTLYFDQRSQISGKAMVVPNVNDAGPFGARFPDIGAIQPFD